MAAGALRLTTEEMTRLAPERLLPGEPVYRLPEQVGMAVVPGVPLDHVAHDPAQAGGLAVGPGSLGQLSMAGVGQRFGDQGARGPRR